MPSIKLLRTHTHSGVAYFPGAIIEADEASALWIVQHGIGIVARENPVPVAVPNLDPIQESVPAPLPEPRRSRRDSISSSSPKE